jgi:hypothetical protein
MSLISMMRSGPKPLASEFFLQGLRGSSPPRPDFGTWLFDGEEFTLQRHSKPIRPHHHENHCHQLAISGELQVRTRLDSQRQ